MKNKVIGITADIKDKFFEIEKFYFDSILKSGGIPMMLPMVNNKINIKKICSVVDGIIISGSRDIDPKFYGQKKTKKINSLDIKRTLSEFAYIKEIYSNKKKKILGICGGMQLINVFFKGTLIQDIKSHKADMMDHIKTKKHKIDIFEKTLLKKIFKSNTIIVNSFHHQAVNKIGKNLIASSIAKDGIIESIESLDMKIIGVQWHPELIKNRKNLELFNWLLN